MQIAVPLNEQIVIYDRLQLASSGDESAGIYLLFFLILVGAVFGRFIAKKINQPAVLGELVAGVLIGIIMYQLNSPVITLMRHQDDVNKIVESKLSQNVSWSDAAKKIIPAESLGADGYGTGLISVLESPEFSSINFAVQAIFLFSSLGVLLLLFVVGLETSMDDMVSVGGMAMVTAVIGVVAPSLLGYFITMIMLPDHDPNLYLFVGATLCATSIGITARVFKDMGKLNIPELRIVLGAAVIDDILGLIILSVVAGIISSGSIQLPEVLIILLKAILFIGITLYAGKKFLRKNIKVAAILDNRNIRLLFPFALLMFLSWLSDRIGLASIVGAFAAGLIIKEEYFNEITKNKSKTVKDVIEPIEMIFAPVFFVIMGLQVDIFVFANFNILGIALILTFVAVLGKFISGIFAKGMDKKIIGIGMVPRGEVGLIFASIGKGIGVLDNALFSAIIIVVILTTFITPPWLKWAFSKYDYKH
jgi:Kef-type K+ transport system membrane component KefB